MRVLFVGESWLGSCARSLKEALRRLPDVEIDEVNEDLLVPKHRARWLRAVHRLLRPAYKVELYEKVLQRVWVFRPNVVLVFKGHSLSEDFIRRLRREGVTSVNIYPDCSPHAYGRGHRAAVGVYDLVISTKPFHPSLWRETYGYSNRCEFVPQGYDPTLHLVPDPPTEQRFDLAMVATWRREYGQLLQRLGELLDSRVSVGIGGTGWVEHRADYPPHWVFPGALQGRSYVEWLRSGRICLAPVTREVTIEGCRQPGDEDTTRTYELAAAHCFFIHRRTPFTQALYDESTEVPMFDTPEELAHHIDFFLSNPAKRAQMAAAAHRRAVPAYSLDSRAAEIVEILDQRDASDALRR